MTEPPITARKSGLALALLFSSGEKKCQPGRLDASGKDLVSRRVRIGSLAVNASL